MWDGMNGWGKRPESWSDRHPLATTVVLIVITILLTAILYVLVAGMVRGSIIEPPKPEILPVWVSSQGYQSVPSFCTGSNCQFTFAYSAGNALVVYSFEYCDGFTAHITGINNGHGDSFAKESYLYSVAWCGAGNQIYQEIWVAMNVHTGGQFNVTFSKAPATLNLNIAQFQHVNFVFNNVTANDYSGSSSTPSITIVGASYTTAMISEAPPTTQTTTSGVKMPGQQTDDFLLGRSFEYYDNGTTISATLGAASFWAANSVFLEFINPLPIVTTLSATSISEFSATLNGYLNSTGGTATATVGFLISTDPSLSGATNITVSTVQVVGAFLYADSSLFTSTTYYFRAWAFNTNGAYVVGSIYSFGTSSTFPNQVQIWDWFWIVLFVALCVTALWLSHEGGKYRVSHSRGKRE